MTIYASEMDALAFLRSLKGARLAGCVTDLPYNTKERYRAIGTTTRLSMSASSSNRWFEVMAVEQLVEVLAALYDALAANAYAFLYVDDDTAMLLADVLRVPAALSALLSEKTSKAPRDEIGFAWWGPLTWGKVARLEAGQALKVAPGMGYHGRACTERILVLEKGKSQLREKFSNLLLAPRPPKLPRGATLRSTTAKPIELAELLTRAMAAPGSRVVDPFVGSGTHAEGITRAGCDAVVNDMDLSVFRDWTRNVWARSWMEPAQGAEGWVEHFSSRT